MSRFKRFFFAIWETVEIVFISVATVFIIRSFLVQPFLVSGASMEPNFSDGDYLLIDEITYRFRSPARGEVVVFRFPNDRRIFFIKRIIGLPGERIKSENGRIRIYENRGDAEGFLLSEKYLLPSTRTPGSFDTQLESDEYFMVGDNRSYSYDSRSWGSVRRKEITGLTRVRVLPLSEFTLEKAPAY